MDRELDRWKDREIVVWWYGGMIVDRGVVTHDEGGERWRKSRKLKTEEEAVPQH